MNVGTRGHVGELLCSLGLLAIGLFVLVDTGNIPARQTFSGVGPRLFTYIIGTVLVGSGALLAWRALAGGWRNMPEDQAAHATPDWRAFVLISAGIVLQMVVVGTAGFILAGAGLVVLVARGFGSTRVVRDVVVGLALSTAAYLTFTRLLSLSLPAGWLPFL
jgi:putative tricarboxylic transport membrane protein